MTLLLTLATRLTKLHKIIVKMIRTLFLTKNWNGDYTGVLSIETNSAMRRIKYGRASPDLKTGLTDGSRSVEVLWEMRTGIKQPFFERVKSETGLERGNGGERPLTLRQKWTKYEHFISKVWRNIRKPRISAWFLLILCVLPNFYDIKFTIWLEP